MPARENTANKRLRVAREVGNKRYEALALVVLGHA